MGKRDIFTRTRRNIMFSSLAIVLICLMAFSLFIQFFYRARLFKGVDQQILTHKNMILNEQIIKKKGEDEEIIIPAPLTPDLISFVWKDGQIADQSPHTYFGENKYPVFPSGYSGEVITLESGNYTYRAISFEKEGLIIQLLMNVDSEIESVKQLEKANIISLVGLIGIALALAYYLATLVLKPVRKAYNQQVHFVQDASHEMRTPLAVLKGEIELITSHAKEQIEDHFEELSRMMSEIRGLEKLNSDLLLLSKEDIEGSIVINLVDLEHFTESLTEYYVDLAQMQGKDFSVLIQCENRQVKWDEIKVKRCLTILLENAFKYTREGDQIKLIIQSEIKYIKIQVMDTGRGIKEEDKARIFDRFFRSSDVRAEAIEGSGIGLSLLQSLANTLRINVKVQSIDQKGSCFTLEIPISMEELY